MGVYFHLFVLFGFYCCTLMHNWCGCLLVCLNSGGGLCLFELGLLVIWCYSGCSWFLFCGLGLICCCRYIVVTLFVWLFCFV